MVHRAARDNREASGWFAGRAGHAKLAGCAVGLAVVWAALALAATLAPRLMIDARACAVLASACLNLLIAVIGTRLCVQRTPVTKPVWKTLLQLARLALRHDRAKQERAKPDDATHDDAPPPAADESAQWQALLRELPWRPAVVPLGAIVSLALVVCAWAMPAPAELVAGSGGVPAPLLVAGVGALLLAFAALYAERVQTHRAEQAASISASASVAQAPAALAGLLRVLLVAALSVAVGAAWFAQTGEPLTWLVRLVAALSGLVAVELAVRSVWAAFASSPPSAAWFLHSALANALRVQARPLAALNAQLRMRYGIDLRQNWALQSFVRLLPGAIVAVIVLGWLLGGVAVLGPDQRAVYERFGAPVAVWQPGLHVGLPWPFGRARVIDNGAVHQLIVSGSANDTNDANDANDASQAARPVAADAAPPDQLNRLWDVAHPWETTQVIAGTSGDQQAFQVVSADVRLDYRIALSDAAARAALYRAVDMDETVRAIANRAVVRYLASRTLQSLIDTPQTAMANTLRATVQGELDRLASGIEVMAVVIESVHPP
ncbi:SPFH domain-containing protein, partial [Paraburkholderia sp.]|uniref:SPFH domain-containing protein n=1 Tax=Paraburkholderia sp. TaxID=1926495 RepID=UPI00286F897D